MMSFAEPSDRPTKKRRFFVDDSPVQEHAFDQHRPTNDGTPSTTADEGRNGSRDINMGGIDENTNVFDRDQIIAITGEQLSDATLKALEKASDGDVNRAINMYFDGSWKTFEHTIPARLTSTTNNKAAGNITAAFKTGSSRVQSKSSPSGGSPREASPRAASLSAMPDKRYIGAFGVAGWTTKSGSNLLRSGEKIKIERSAPRTPAPKAGRGGLSRTAMKKPDVVVRFLNNRGEEVGRLEQDNAAWISTLLDQHVVEFEGSCIFAPDRVRTNDTVFLQLRTYLSRETFDSANYVKPLENNRQTGIFEAKETDEERKLRLRQVALVRLFSEINLAPARVNEMTEKHKREGILQAAELAEKHDEKPKDGSTQNGGSSPSSDDNEEGQELEQDQLDSLYKKAQSFDFDTPEMQPGETFNMDLRKYQKQALHWMVGKEKDQKSENKEVSMHPLWEEYRWPTKDVDEKDLPSVDDQNSFYVNPYSGELSLDFPVQEQNCLGGILADEMGLGKTIEMLSLVHSHTSEYGLGGGRSTGSMLDLPRLPKNSSAVERAPCTTLVVAPMSLLAQWASEAEKASKPGTLKTLMYYGADKSANLQSLCCEANAANAPNLIVTSYGTVLSEYTSLSSSGTSKGSSGGLFSLNYFRIILDEAHMIKNRQSKTAKACYELSATHRWVLTGTPIVNRLEDLFSLVRFLRVEPWSNFSFWKTFITVPFESKDFLRALDVVQTVLEPLVMRRTKDMRTPSGEPLVPLPPKSIDIEKVELSKIERELYDHIFARAKRTFSANVEAGTLMKSYTTIFAQILRLRQSCDHPALTRNKAIAAEEAEAEAASDVAAGLADDMDLGNLIERFEAEAAAGEEDASKFGAHVLKQIQDDVEAECPICSEEPMDDQAVTGCWHSACKKCLLDYIEHQTAKNEIPRCFNCREPINARDVFEVVRHDVDEEEEQGLFVGSRNSQARVSLRRVNQINSAKIASLLSHLKKLKKEKPGIKSVVFSQFTSFLDILEPELSKAGIPHLRFDGSMAQKQRAAVLTEFAERSRGCVLLLSLRAGGVGLNLTCAKRVFMMDPWWSWAVEAQAIDRVHRMGQTDEVKVVRFVVDASIEEKMLKIQDRKKFIASSLGMMSEEEKKTQRIEDIRELLS